MAVAEIARVMVTDPNAAVMDARVWMWVSVGATGASLRLGLVLASRALRRRGVLDEATAALDPDGEAAVQDSVAQLAAGKIVIVIAHRLHTITGADQILVLDGGRLAEAGTHRDLLARGGLYARMWRAQQDGAFA